MYKAVELLRITNSKITNLKCRIIMLKSMDNSSIDKIG